MSQADTLEVTHDAEKRRFQTATDAGTAFTEYMRVGNTLIFTHTEVPEALEGQGIGSKVVKEALEYVRAEGLSASPLCPFVKAYVQRHPEYRGLVRMGG